MSDYSLTAPARLATRLAFFAGGFAIACWAPLIPFVKENVGADEAQLGLLLLCLGVGSLIAMPVTGWLAARSGARPMILLGGIGLGVTLPVLALAQNSILLGFALLIFGAALGTLDVSMNVHAVEVENAEDRPLMSGFHAQYSIGGFVGAGLVTALLTLGLAPIVTALIGAALTLGAIMFTSTRLLRARGGDPEPFAAPRGIVLLFAVLAAITFLLEGAILDWSALLLIERELAQAQNAGVGFMLFSIAMVIGRLTGDRVVAALGGFRILFFGGLLAILGVLLNVFATNTPVVMSGFVLVGLGAANIVPVVFSLAGRQKVMPAGMAIASVTTTGYAGILLGPALIGFAAEKMTLTLAFALLAVLAIVIPATARIATKGD